MKSKDIKMLVEGAIMVALAYILSCLPIVKFPWGGTITLLSMLPIAVFSIKYGVKKGLFVSFVFSLLQLGQGIAVDGIFSWGLTTVMLISCIFLDYIFAFTSVGLAGIFRNKGVKGWVLGTVLAITVRYAIHVISGAVLWHSAGLIWGALTIENEWLYSLVYNGAYMLPEMIFTTAGAYILFKVPQTRKLLASEA